MWRTIDGFGMYEVSDTGQVRRKSTGLILKQHSWDGRYLRVSLYGTPNKCEGRSVHRLVADAFHGKSNHEVNHKDGNKHNNAASNLEYVTRSENMKHAHRIGLQCNKGERHSRHKLKEGDIVEIRRAVQSGMTQSEIGKLFGVCQSNVSRISSGKAWSHTNMDAVGEKPICAV